MRAITSLLLVALLVLAGCGGSEMGSSSAQKPVDPSGNWAMTLTDGSGKTVQLAAIFNETGTTVAAVSVTAAGNPAPFACVPLSASLSGGAIQNLTNLIGTITFTDSATGVPFGSWTFSVTLTLAGLSFTGTYSGLPACTGIGASGTFTGMQVPSMTGNWTGTVQPCTYDGTTGTCTLTGVAGSMTASLNQNDATGDVTGTYALSGVSGFSSGTVAIVPPFDVLSGHCVQFTMTDQNSTKFVANGGCGSPGTGLGFDRSLTAIVANVANNCTSGCPHWLLEMTH